MICQLVGGPADGKEVEVDDRAISVTVPMQRWAGLRSLLYTRRKPDPSKFDYSPPVTMRETRIDELDGRAAG